MIETSPRHPGSTACALEGCGVPVVRRAGGGRPRLYCSDAHRAEARRRRLTASGGFPGDRRLPPAEEGAGLTGVRALLVDALGRLDRAEAEAPRDDALVAAIRAEATEEVLRAQQSAADAARKAADAQERLTRERGEWQTARGRLVVEADERARAVEELSGALDGARAELEQELLRHHEDAARADALIQAQRVTHAGEMEQAVADASELRQRLGSMEAAVRRAQLHATRTEHLLSERASAAVELEVRAARAEEQSRLTEDRLAEARGELQRLRRELAEERRHHRAIEKELSRRMAQAPTSRTPRRTRRPAEPVPVGRSNR